MREQFTFVGKNVTPRDEAEAAHSLDRTRRKENEFDVANELPKTPGELATIDLLNDCLRREFDEMEIPEIPELRPERFHVMSAAWFEKNGQGFSGLFKSFPDQVFLDRTQADSTAQFYETIFHEGVHAASRLKFRLNTGEKTIDQYRTGYSITNTAVPDDEHEHFRAFNEAVVEMTTEQMFYKYQQSLQKKLGISEADLEQVKFGYSLFREVVWSICEGLAERSGKKPIEYWEKIKRGQFTGDMMHLRDIEYTYGKGALRLLDALTITSGDAAKKMRDEISKQNKKVLAYFSGYNRPGEDKAEERSKLAHEILGEEDFQKYCV